MSTEPMPARDGKVVRAGLGSRSVRTVLFVHSANDLYGASTVLLETVKGLDRSRFSPVVVLPEDTREDGALAAELNRNDVPFEFCPLALLRRKYFTPKGILLSGFELIRTVRLLTRIIREWEVDLVHSNTLTVCTGAIAARLTRTPHIWHVHEMLVRPVPVRRALHFLAPRLSSTVVCISEAVRQHVLKDEPAAAAKMSVVHNGLPLENFVSVSNGSSIRREFGIPASAPLVGMVGRINHWKGQSVFVEAAKSVLASFPDANFLVVGSVFADEVHYLDLGLVVLEAMAAGKAVIATAYGGPLEMIEDGVSGHFVPPADPGALAAKICVCLADLRSSKEMGRRAQERAMRMFPVSRYLDRTQSVYEQALKPA